MIYSLIKLPIRLALKIFCVDIQLVNQENRYAKGPLLLVANHPNSFLDAIIIAAQFKEPIYFLARGDAFRKPWHRFLLGLLHMIPVYRLSEGRENLHLNEHAFNRSAELLEKGKIVLIFIEGICLHTHQLQPFKKGAARIALTEKKHGRTTGIMPVSIAYNSFQQFGKSIRIQFEKPYKTEDLFKHEQDAQNMQEFNRILFESIQEMIQVPVKEQKNTNLVYALLSSIGLFLHIPIYSLIKRFVKKKTRNTVFYDSVLFGMLLLLYPLYLCVLTALFFTLHLPNYLIAIILLTHPITAWFAVHYKIKP